MNGSLARNSALLETFKGSNPSNETEVVIGAPAVYLSQLVQNIPHGWEVAGENCYIENKGAYTGEISPEMLKDVGAKWVIVGHSERRSIFKESDEFIAEKVAKALQTGLKVVFCCGELLEEREADKTQEVVERQLNAVVGAISENSWKDIVIAYEPVWAIGTGKVATPEQAQEVHAAIRAFLAKNVSKNVAESTRIVYGGSVNGQNCVELAKKEDIDGFLVGGASLKPEFISIINARD
ncbi:triosephosphate isomerase [Spiromyces aspiralis]|uniref:Triosephosphate isomerase n=1 Tax=Spiromyces aspiralis TaxID=68401 RepID=A0ACC1HGT9_9FUNG|nr:triosephosphate isomerase [Spiromyces aspiralis]